MMQRNGMELVRGIVFGSPSSFGINFIAPGVHTSLIYPVWGSFDVFWGRRPSDFYHSWYYFPPHLVVVPWGHASEGCYNLLAPPCATLWLFYIFYVVQPPHWAILVMCPFYYWVDPCMMYPVNLSCWLDWFYRLIVTLNLLDLGFMYLRDLDSIYWDALSVVKRLLALRILNTRKLLQKLFEALWMYLDVIVMPLA